VRGDEEREEVVVARVETRGSDLAARADVDLPGEDVLRGGDARLAVSAVEARGGAPAVETLEHLADVVVPDAVVDVAERGAQREPAVLVEEQVAVARVRLACETDVEAVGRDLGGEAAEVRRGGADVRAELAE